MRRSFARNALRSVSEPERTLPFLVAGLTASIVAIGLLFLLKQRETRQLAEKLDITIDRHIDGLVSVRAQSVRFDTEGRLNSKEWQQEIERFLDSQLSSTLSARELRQLEARRARFVRQVADRVAAGVARLPVYQ
jgi:hypothetical protein